jgi:flavin-dependent dehydrogenase
MFVWVYNKTVDGQDLWVVGSGYDRDLKTHCEAFLAYIRNQYNLNGKIVNTEGYSSSIEFDSADRVWLGQGRILMIGDAAGLEDITRGVGMDSAALSGRLAAKAIIAAHNGNKCALDEYAKYTRKMVEQTKKNQSQGISKLNSNQELQKHLSTGMKKAGLPDGSEFHFEPFSAY